jgi:hypothetical protein
LSSGRATSRLKTTKTKPLEKQRRSQSRDGALLIREINMTTSDLAAAVTSALLVIIAKRLRDPAVRAEIAALLREEFDDVSKPSAKFAGGTCVTRRATFLLELTPLPHVDGVRALRKALKLLRRHCGLQCLAITEIGDPPAQVAGPLQPREIGDQP